MNLEGIIPLAGGVYGWLLATGKVPANPKDPEQLAEWRRKFGPILKVAAPLAIIYGLLLLVGVFGA
jgi:hypothetical protein